MGSPFLLLFLGSATFSDPRRHTPFTRVTRGRGGSGQRLIDQRVDVGICHGFAKDRCCGHDGANQLQLQHIKVCDLVDIASGLRVLE